MQQRIKIAFNSQHALVIIKICMYFIPYAREKQAQVLLQKNGREVIRVR